MSATARSISLVLPGFNEESNIESTVRRSLATLRRFTDAPEVVVVDDGSVDRSPAIAERLQAEDGAVRVIHNPLNLGVGTSLLIGLRAARSELVLHNAMDEPFDLADLERMLPLFPEHDAVVAVRTDRSAHSPWRKLTSLVNYWLLRLLFRVPLRDMNFIQVYKRELVQRVVVKARSPAFVLPELLIRAHDSGARIAQVSAAFHPRLRGRASHGHARDILWTLADMISLWLEGREARR